MHTGQLYLDDGLTDRVLTAGPYDEHTGSRTPNERDGIYASGGRESTLAVAKRGNGYVGTMMMACEASSPAGPTWATRTC